MSTKRKPLLVGSFILAGIVLFIGGLLLLARESVFNRPVEYVVYFTGALDGLDVGADVTYRGVKVGSVQDIRLSYDAGIGDVVMPVIIRINSGKTSGKVSQQQLNESVEQMIGRGLRAQLQTPSLLTGKAIVALDLFPGQIGYVRDPSVVDLLQIPSVPSRIDQAADLLYEIASSLKEAPVAKTLESVNRTLEAVEKILGSAELEQGVSVFAQSFANLAEITDQVQSGLPVLLGNLNEGSDELKHAMADLRHAADTAVQTLEMVNELAGEGRRSLGQNSELQYEVLQALQNLSRAGKSIQRMSESLEQQPESIIFGKKYK